LRDQLLYNCTLLNQSMNQSIEALLEPMSGTAAAMSTAGVKYQQQKPGNTLQNKYLFNFLWKVGSDFSLFSALSDPFTYFVALSPFSFFFLSCPLEQYAMLLSKPGRYNNVGLCDIKIFYFNYSTGY